MVKRLNDGSTKHCKKLTIVLKKVLENKYFRINPRLPLRHSRCLLVSVFLSILGKSVQRTFFVDLKFLYIKFGKHFSLLRSFYTQFTFFEKRFHKIEFVKNWKISKYNVYLLRRPNQRLPHNNLNNRFDLSFPIKHFGAEDLCFWNLLACFFYFERFLVFLMQRNRRWNVWVETVLEMRVSKLYLKCVIWNCTWNACVETTWKHQKNNNTQKKILPASNYQSPSF